MAPLSAATVSGYRPEAKRGTLGVGLRQRELTVSTLGVAGHFGVAVMLGTPAPGML